MAALPLLANKVLALLDARAPAARTAADLGDPSPLNELFERAVRDAGARALLDPSAQRDLAGEDLPLSDALQTWAAARLPTEARWRAEAASWLGPLGRLQVDLSSLEAWGQHADPDRRTAAWLAYEAAWGPRAEALGAWLHRPEAPKAAVGVEPATAGGLILPSAELVATFAAPGQFDPALLAAPTLPTTPVPVAVVGAGPLFALARELAAALGHRLTDFGGWRHAIAGAEADFTDLDPPAPGSLPLRGLVPLRRPGASANAPGPTARAWALRAAGDFDAYALPRLLARVGTWYVHARLVTAPSDPLRAVRAAALAVAGLALEAAWAVNADGDGRALDATLTQAGLPGAPRAWRRLVVRNTWAEARPGESRALYMYGARLLRGLVTGASAAFALRDAHDEDWSERDLRLGELTEAEGLDLAVLTAWLQEAARL